MADCFAQLESIATETSTTNQHDAVIAYRLYLAGHSIHLLNESAELLQHTLALVCTCAHSQESYLRDMACSTLSLLCNGCKHMPVLADSNGVQALLAQMGSLLNSLEPRQVFKKNEWQQASYSHKATTDIWYLRCCSYSNISIARTISATTNTGTHAYAKWNRKCNR